MAIKKYANKMIEVQMNKKVGGFLPGNKTHIRVDAKGVPVDPFWRRRFQDAETDECIVIIKKQKKKENKKQTIEQKED